MGLATQQLTVCSHFNEDLGRVAELPGKQTPLEHPERAAESSLKQKVLLEPLAPQSLSSLPPQKCSTALPTQDTLRMDILGSAPVGVLMWSALTFLMHSE